MLLWLSAAVKATVAHGVQALGWCVPQDAGDELVSAQTQGLGAAIAVVGVGHANKALGVDGQGAVSGHGPALDVGSEVKRDATSVTSS